MTTVTDKKRTIAKWAKRRRRLMREDGGQALVMAVIFAALMIALIPVIAIDVTFENSSVVTTVTSEDALAAAEAAVQAYRNDLDNVPGYYAYNSGNPPSGGDAALTGWQSIPNTTPPEAFHYVPNDSQLTATSGGSVGQMLLEVTGRAGYSGDYKYRSLLVGFHLSGILTDSYYSEYELNDPNEPGTMPNVTVTPPSGSSYSEPMSNFSLPAWSYTSASGYTYSEAAGESLSSALCLYHTYDENLWIDSLNSVTNPWVTVGGAHPIANATNPYYGPYYESSFSYTFPAGSSLAGTSISISAVSPAGVCDAYGVGIYDGSVYFNGIAYTNDQFALCGSPHFNGSPPLVSGAPVNDYLADNWPGTSSVMVGGVTKYKVVGWFDEFHYGGCGGSPIYGSGASPQTATLGGSQHLPATNQALMQYADGLNGNQGCLYTGPTMIEFVGNGQMNVWSPLTKNTEPDLTSGTPANCGTFSTSNPWQTGLSLPPDGVIYVQSVPSNSSDKNYWASIPTVGSGSGQVASGSGTALPSGATCINPYFYSQSSSSQYCSEGDALVEGELHGQVTVGSSNYIIQTRDITYACVDGSGGASSTDPSSVAACGNSGTNDVLGLVPQNEFVIAHPTSGLSNVGTCTDDGTESSPGISNVTPTCDISNDILDAAVVTIHGSTYVQNFNQGSGLGNLYEEGSNINYFPGFNGVSGGAAGYSQNLSYDTRLSYLQPPHILQATDSVWDLTAFVICGDSNATAGGTLNCPALP